MPDWEYLGHINAVGRLVVPGGWLYRMHMKGHLAFVPAPPRLVQFERWIDRDTYSPVLIDPRKVVYLYGLPERRGFDSPSTQIRITGAAIADFEVRGTPAEVAARLGFDVVPLPPVAEGGAK